MPSAGHSSFRPRHPFFIGVDSDGCALDSMIAKHRRAFIPAALATWNLHPLASAFAEAEEWVNLHSSHRGINRFAGLLLTFERLSESGEWAAGGADLPDLDELRAFVQSGLTQSNAGLQAFLRERPSPTATSLLAWSIAADARLARQPDAWQPFPGVSESLERAARVADTLVVSAGSSAALREDWARSGLLRHMQGVAGQEHGTKTEQLTTATAGRYASGHILMIGDAPGDLRAARAAGALFFPIQPGRETQSWRRFHDEILDRFTAGTYAGACENEAITSFQRGLGAEPDRPLTVGLRLAAER